MILIFSLEEHATPLSLSFFDLNVTACSYELFFYFFEIKQTSTILKEKLPARPPQ